MGSTNIHYSIRKEEWNSPVDAYKHLVDTEVYNYGDDPYNGTISTCRYGGRINKPLDEIEYHKALNRIDKWECKYYETEEHYVFIGWAST